MLEESTSIPNQIVDTYLSWSQGSRNSGRCRSEVVVDNLSGQLPSKVINDQQAHANFHRILDHCGDSLGHHTNRLRQSIHYLEHGFDRATIDGVKALGGRMIQVQDHELESLLKQAKILKSQDNSISDFDWETWGIEEILRHAGDSVRPIFDFISKFQNSSFRALVTTNDYGIIEVLAYDDRESFKRNCLISLHEICGHVFHFCRRGAPARDHQPNDADPTLCVAIHTQDAFYVEAIAQFIPFYLLKNGNPQARPQQALSDLLTFTAHMGIIHQQTVNILEGRNSIEESAKAHLDFFPESDLRTLQERYARTIETNVGAHLALNYYSSYKSIEPLANSNLNLSKAEFSDLLDHYHTPESLDEFVYAKLSSSI